MIDNLLQFIAPHHCYECGKVGLLMCDNCKYNIISEPFSGCVVCQRVAPNTNICNACRTSYDQAWVITPRSGSIEKLLNGFKFEHQKAAASVIAELLDQSLPLFNDKTIVVIPVPTISSHIRRRGYDHMRLVARQFARLRSLKCSFALERRSSSVQLGASKRERVKQARSAFCVDEMLRDDIVYLLLDDVITTGATMEYASIALKQAGAETVWVAALARQPLDKG